MRIMNSGLIFADSFLTANTNKRSRKWKARHNERGRYPYCSVTDDVKEFKSTRPWMADAFIKRPVAARGLKGPGSN